MEVMEDSHAPETSVQPTRRDFLTAGGRFAMLGIFTAVTGYAIGSQPRRSAQRESTIAMDGEEWIDPTKLDERTRLIEKHLRVARAQTHDLCVRIFKFDGVLEVNVNGKAYRLQECAIPGVSVGRAIDEVYDDGPMQIIESQEYGTIDIDEQEAIATLEKLERSDERVVRVNPAVRIHPKEGTLFATSLAMMRMLNGWKKGDDERYHIAFIRQNPVTQLVMKRND